MSKFRQGQYQADQWKADEAARKQAKEDQANKERKAVEASAAKTKNRSAKKVKQKNAWMDFAPIAIFIALLIFAWASLPSWSQNDDFYNPTERAAIMAANAPTVLPTTTPFPYVTQARPRSVWETFGSCIGILLFIACAIGFVWLMQTRSSHLRN